MASGKEAHIKEVAKRIFFKEGKFDAKLHEIAKAAEVNKALLHYYFRDREKLLQVVYEDALAGSFLKMFEMLSEDKPFEKKIGDAVEHMIEYVAEYPFIESFIISQVNAAGDNKEALLPVKAAKMFIKKFSPEVEDYLRKNKIKKTPPEQFIVNMMALCAYPASTKPLIRGIFNFTEKDFSEFLKERKKQVTQLILMKR